MSTLGGRVQTIQLREESAHEAPAPSGSSSNSINGSSPSILSQNSSSESDSEGEPNSQLQLSENLRRLCFSAQQKYFGPSSGHLLMLNAQSVKKACLAAHNMSLPTNHYKRDHFWAPPSLGFADVPMVQGFIFPESSHLSALISLYFAKVNIIYPILHQQSFEQSIVDGHHLIDQDVGAILLLVCSLGARHLDNITEENRWRWFQQVQASRIADFSPMHELQYHCLTVLFLHGMSSPMPTWTVIGDGIHKAIDMGVHRRKPKNYTMTFEDEMKKRAFWVLVTMDRLVSSFLGRPSAIRDEDFDLEYPIEFDDEYWTAENAGPTQRFSRLAAFNHYLKLCEISALAISTVYAPKKPKLAAKLAGDAYRPRVVEQLEGEILDWKTALPLHRTFVETTARVYLLTSLVQGNTDHLEGIFQQSTFLLACFYFVQMQIYKPSIFRAKDDSPARKTCLDAANAGIEILDKLFQNGILYCPELMYTALTAAIILVANMWIMKRQSPSTFSCATDIGKVRAALRILHVCESRNIIAGRFCDLLSDLSFGLDLSVTPDSQEQTSNNGEDEQTNGASFGSVSASGPALALDWNIAHDPSHPVFPSSGTGFSIPPDLGFSSMNDMSWLSDFQE
ncbi:Gypsy retrotransposon integrase-like protein 1 [Paramarasmius palmivorus]|uniref:Gypsy retrotransposon integrase-like protein 1 n=1 Tax=Paramarasmius palmivorus TaxID=297713 RepID=A0AAW0DED0_9AGAR